MESVNLGVAFAFGTSLSWAIGILPFTKASLSLGPNVVNHFRLLLSTIILTGINIIFFSLSFKNLFSLPSYQSWMWIGLSGVVGLALGDYFSFSAFALLGSRMGSMFSTLAPAAALLFGYFLLGETINYVGLVGILITIGGIIWLIKSKQEHSIEVQHDQLGRGMLFGILAAVCQGIGLAFAKKGLVNTELSQAIAPLHASWIRIFTAAFSLYLLTGIQGNIGKINRPIIDNKKNGLPSLLLGTLFGPLIGVSLSLFAIARIEVSIAQTIFSFVPIFVIFLTYLFQKEKTSLTSLMGVAIAIVGVIILIWRNQIQDIFLNLISLFI